MVDHTFNTGEKVIWDSRFGYDIGYFISAEGAWYNSYLVDLRTGVVQGEVSHSRHEIHPYTEEKIKELTAKYGYEKKFSDEF